MTRKNQKQKSSGNPVFQNYRFAPLTRSQAEARNDFEDGKNLVLSGYAGTGKTWLAIAMAIGALIRGEVNHIHVVRSAVASRNIGFLPGTEQQKLEVYEKAIKLLFNKILHRADAYEVLKSGGFVSFGSTSFERGITYEKTCIIVDEFQNCDWKELSTMVTRLADSSRVIFSGDTRQSDLREQQSGFAKFVRVIGADIMQDYFSHHEFEINDIVRGEMVKAWIIASEADEIKNNPRDCNEP